MCSVIPEVCFLSKKLRPKNLYAFGQDTPLQGFLPVAFFNLFDGYGDNRPVTRDPVTNRVLLAFPQQLAEARTFFDCPTLPFTEMENDNGPGSADGHWESRTHEVLPPDS